MATLRPVTPLEEDALDVFRCLILLQVTVCHAESLSTVECHRLGICKGARDNEMKG